MTFSLIGDVQPQAPQVKRCTKCGETKPLDAFHRNKRKPDGLEIYCKPCRKEQAARLYADNKDRINARNRSYYQQNASAVTQRTNAYKRSNPDRVRQCNADYYRANVEAHQRRNDARRARLANATHEPYSRADIFAAYGGTCAYCDAPAEHLDHVVALSRGGADAAHNLLPACAPCNLSKGARSLAEWASTFGPA